MTRATGYVLTSDEVAAILALRSPAVSQDVRFQSLCYELRLKLEAERLPEAGGGGWLVALRVDRAQLDLALRLAREQELWWALLEPCLGRYWRLEGLEVPTSAGGAS